MDDSVPLPEGADESGGSKGERREDHDAQTSNRRAETTKIGRMHSLLHPLLPLPRQAASSLTA